MTIKQIALPHDDVIKWKHFPCYWPFVRGIHLSQTPVTRSFDVFFDLRLNKQLSKQSRRRWFETPLRSLWRYCNDLPVSELIFPPTSVVIITLLHVHIIDEKKHQKTRPFVLSACISCACATINFRLRRLKGGSSMAIGALVTNCYFIELRLREMRARVVFDGHRLGASPSTIVESRERVAIKTMLRVTKVTEIHRFKFTVWSCKLQWMIYIMQPKVSCMAAAAVSAIEHTAVYSWPSD